MPNKNWGKAPLGYTTDTPEAGDRVMALLKKRVFITGFLEQAIASLRSAFGNNMLSVNLDVEKEGTKDVLSLIVMAVGDPEVQGMVYDKWQIKWFDWHAHEWTTEDLTYVAGLIMVSG